MLAGCGSSEEQGLEKPPRDLTEPGLESKPCDLAVPELLRTSSGGRLRFSVEVTDGSDVSVSVPARWRLSMDGEEHVVRVPYETEGSFAIEVVATCTESSATKEIAVEIHRPYWSTLSVWSESDPKKPSFRQTPNFWIDPSAPGHLMMLGGNEPQSGFTSALWSFDLEKKLWTQLGEGTSMPVLVGGRIAEVPGESAVLFVDGFSGWADTGTPFTAYRIEYGGESIDWSVVEGADAPSSASFGGAFVYVPHLGRYLYACGIVDSGAHCEMMLYDPEAAVWERPVIRGDERPDGRYGFAYAYDPETKRLVLFSGGRDATPDDPVNAAPDTWALELGEEPFVWTKLDAGEAPPRRNPCFALDEKGHRLLVYGGTPDAAEVLDGVYALDLDRGAEKWTALDVPLPPPSRSSCAGAYDAEGERFLIGFGNSTTAIYTDLHALNL